MNFRNNFVLTSCAVLGAFFVGTTRAALKPTGFPQTFQDVSFSQRNQVKQAGYEPYKDASAYVIPKFIENDDEFYEQLCKRDKQECCRRRPDFKGCQPQISYELYGGDDSKCNPKLPKSYRTDQGATISCIPTRNKSVFLGWCTDAARNPADCAMSQTIPVGEKDDKFFWAKWDCVAPAVKRGEQCVCNDPTNMDDNCMCSGEGMREDPTTHQCECVANTNPAKPEARIENKKCVCIDSSMDINTNCTTPKDDGDENDNKDDHQCVDAKHKNNECVCLSGKEDDNGFCRCIDDAGNIDLAQDIDSGCACKAGQKNPDNNNRCMCKANGKFDSTLDAVDGCTRPYILIQCRSDHIDRLLQNKHNYHSLGTILWTQLACSKSTQDSIDKCFAPCDKATDKTPFINNLLKNVIPEFCTGNWGDDTYTNTFSPVQNPASVLLYSRQQVDDVMNTIKNSDYSSCHTDRYWYIIGLHRKSDDTYKYYKHKQIGK